MKRTALLLALFPLAALAAPVPKSEQGLHDWGEPIDPLKDCKFEGNRGKLTITIPGKGRILHAGAANMEAPRVLRAVEGDFTLEVTVEADWPAGAALDLKGMMPLFSAGLLAYQDDKNYIKLEKMYYETNGKVYCFISFLHWQQGQLKYNHLDASSTKADPKKPIRLRLKREGGDFIAESSEDGGKTWAADTFRGLNFDAKLKIGVMAAHSTKTEFKPSFSEFKLEKQEAEKP